MKHSQSLGPKHRSGTLLVDVMLGIALLVIFVGAFSIVLIYGEESTQTSGDRIRASEYTQQAIEVAVSLQDGNFSALKPGTYGIRFNETTSQWTLSGSSTTFSGGYLTTLTLAIVDTRTVLATAKTTWNRIPNRPGSITLTHLLTKWQDTKPVGNWSTVTLSGSYVDAGTPLFNDIALRGTTLYITSEISSGGRGLYMFAVADATNPTVLNPGFTLGYAGYGIGIYGNMLYVLTSDAGAELKAYDITTPSSPSLQTSFNLPGSGVAKTLFINGPRLYVGATGLGPMSFRPERLPHTPLLGFIDRAEAAFTCFSSTGSTVPCASSSSSSAGAYSSLASPTGNDFFVFDISVPSEIRYRSSLYAQGVNAIAVSGTSAYLASPLDTAELSVANIINPSSVVFATGSVNGAPNGGYNLNDRTLNALAVAAVGSSALLGTEHSGATQEVVLFDVRIRGVPVTPPGPWYYYASGSVVDTGIDATGCYGFVATTWKTEALQIIRIRNRSMQKMTTYAPPAPSDTGARGMLYDPVRDVTYLVNQRGLYILRPAAPPSVCG